MGGCLEEMNAKDSAIDRVVLAPLQETLEEFSKLQELLEKCIDIDKAKQNDYVINPDFCADLKGMSQGIEKALGKMRDLRRHVENDLCVNKTIDLVPSESYTYVFEVDKKEGDKGFRNSSNQYRIISVKMNKTTFTCEELKMLVAAYLELDGEYRARQAELVDKVLEIVSSYHPVLERVSSVIAKFDVLTSFAEVSAQYRYVQPKMSGMVDDDDQAMEDESHPAAASKLVLLESRHPLIEVQDPTRCIANDCKMVKGESSLAIITGPNMGGKSTYIRQIAIALLFAQIGCFVPCAQAELPVVDCIIARVGASDHQLRGISTFMSEMIEASCMLKTATANSFIIMDELGRGTATDEGFGLAWAIAEEIANEIGAFCLFATHYHEMTAIESEVPSARNLYVSARADEHSLTMLYKVHEGICGRSYGIHIAEMLEFPKEVIQEAKRIQS